MAQNIALVTGASSGIGKPAAEHLAQSGFVVYVAARRIDRLQAMETASIRAVQMDVTDTASVKAGVDHVVSESGRIDLLVNNAGFGSYGSIENHTGDAVRRMFDVNVFGLGEVLRHVVPVMREQHSGRIVNMASVVGRVSNTMLGWYAASKHAVEAVSDALRQELEPFEVQVSIIEPGAIETEFEAVAVDGFLQNNDESEAYALMVEDFGKMLRDSYASAASPSAVTTAVLHAATASSPRRRYIITGQAKMLISMVRYVGYWMYDMLIRRMVTSRVG